MGKAGRTDTVKTILLPPSHYHNHHRKGPGGGHQQSLGTHVEEARAEKLKYEKETSGKCLSGMAVPTALGDGARPCVLPSLPGPLTAGPVLGAPATLTGRVKIRKWNASNVPKSRSSTAPLR